MQSTARGRIFRRREPDTNGPAVSRVSVRLALRLSEAKATDPATADAFHVASQDDDVMDFVIAKANEAKLGALDPNAPATGTGTRDWAGFFSAFGDFLAKILPLLLSLISGLAPIFAPVAAAPAPAKS